MEELLFRGLFLGRYKPLIGHWPAIFSTAIAFILAHIVVVLGLSIAWDGSWKRRIASGAWLYSMREPTC
jgi:membrane protease YdiL (CAAX protease family)